jgi:hypothetical protein
MYKKLVSFIILSSLVFAQSLSIQNESVTDKIYEFDIIIYGNIQISAYQVALSFNQDIINNGQLKFEYIEGSSQLSLVPSSAEIRDNRLSFFSYVNDVLLSGEKRLGRFRLSNTEPFNKVKVDLQWVFDSKINTIIINGDNTVTNQFYFFGSEITLPVQLIKFTGRLLGRKICLNWRTATEVNNYGFEIECFDKNQWRWIGFVRGNGNSNSTIYYGFTDRYPHEGIQSYRLKQIDNDGYYTYSNEVQVVSDKYYFEK